MSIIIQTIFKVNNIFLHSSSIQCSRSSITRLLYLVFLYHYATGCTIGYGCKLITMRDSSFSYDRCLIKQWFKQTFFFLRTKQTRRWKKPKWL